jgi:hypothetical protein
MDGEPRNARGAWAAFVITLLCLASSFVLTGLNVGTLHGATASWNGFGETASWSFLMLVASVLGLIVSVRRPENVLGTVFLAGGLAGALTLVGDHYAGYALITEPGSLPFGTGARIVSFWAFVATWFLAAVLLPALFPTGHALTRRWRAAVWIGGIGAAGWCLMAFRPDAFTDDGLLGKVAGVRNPVAFPGSSMLTPVSDMAILLLFAGTFLAIISMVVRAVRSRGIERQQVKVVAYTIAVTTVLQLVVANTLQLVRFPGSVGLWNAVSLVGVMAIPASLGIALLRYRLYDIDRLINRTIVYLILTALLVGIYAGAVLGLGAATQVFTRGSDVAVAGATLLIAALFFPVRRSIQSFVDRRFYRTRYDAQRTLEEFASKLRMETDLSALRGEVESVARRALQPAHVALWVAKEERATRVLR